jgi:regulator of protease activity HflC (stomatin/prohibitin superfamily)
MPLQTPLLSEPAVAVQGQSMERASGVHEHWDSPAYAELKRNKLLRTDWRVNSMTELNIRHGNTTPGANALRKLAAFCGLPCCGPCILGSCCKMAEVPSGSVLKAEDGSGGFFFLGNGGPLQGVHYYFDCFMRISTAHELNGARAQKGVTIHNGDMWIVIIQQGFIGLAEDMGQPVLLPPGMHQWQSATMHFISTVDLTKAVINLGPYTLLTVDKGYEAVTQNNGKQEVLGGGAVHLLSHRNHKFEKFITTKIQTDNLQRVEVMTGDNVLMHVDATVCWNICDVQRCAERAAETMGADAGQIVKLRGDVLKQAEASLSALIGKVNFSDTFSAATALQVGHTPTATEVVVGSSVGASSSLSSPGGAAGAGGGAEQVALLFDSDKLRDAVTHANDMTHRYGVDVLSINIISAKPADPQLMQSLAKGAVAAAEAQQLETAAIGAAKAATIQAQGEADALKISAAADADAEVTRAEGSRQAAQKLSEHEVAVQLAHIAATGEALKKAKSSLILASEPAAMGSMMLANPSLKLA